MKGLDAIVPVLRALYPKGNPQQVVSAVFAAKVWALLAAKEDGGVILRLTEVLKEVQAETGTDVLSLFLDAQGIIGIPMMREYDQSTKPQGSEQDGDRAKAEQ